MVLVPDTYLETPGMSFLFTQANSQPLSNSGTRGTIQRGRASCQGATDLKLEGHAWTQKKVEKLNRSQQEGPLRMAGLSSRDRTNN